jgi:hypothetical protein
MNFDTTLNIVAFAIGIGATIIGIASAPEPLGQRLWTITILATCGVVLTLFAKYTALKRKHERIKISVLQAVAINPQTFEQLWDIVKLREGNVTVRDISEVIWLLVDSAELIPRRQDWQDVVHARLFYSTVYSKY